MVFGANEIKRKRARERDREREAKERRRRRERESERMRAKEQIKRGNSLPHFHASFITLKFHIHACGHYSQYSRRGIFAIRHSVFSIFPRV